MRARRCAAGAAAGLLTALLATGCGRHDGAATPAPATSPTASAPAGPGGSAGSGGDYERMRQKVDAAESAAAAADRDAASDDDR